MVSKLTLEVQEDWAESAAAGGQLAPPHTPGLHATHRPPLHVDQAGGLSRLHTLLIVWDSYPHKLGFLS